MRTRNSKRIRKNTKRMKGGISRYNFSVLQHYIQTYAKKSVYMPDLIMRIENANADIRSRTRDNPRFISLSERDWCVLIERSFQDGVQFIFGESPLEQRLNRRFNYNHPSTFARYKGSIEPFPLKLLHTTILKTAKKYILTRELLTYIEALKNEAIGPIVITDRDWCELIAECYFRDKIYFIFEDSPLERYLNQIFDYDSLDKYNEYLGKIVDDGRDLPEITFSATDPEPFDVEPLDLKTTFFPAPPRPIRPEPAQLRPEPAARSTSRYEPEPVMPQPVRTLSISQPAQGDQGTCFAHAASLMIFHNMYQEQLTREDEVLYKKNNCNSYLNTTTTFPSYATLLKNCGNSGAARILLYIYIYRMLVKQFGCDGGFSLQCMLYFLKTEYQPNLFGSSDEGLFIDGLLIPVHDRAVKSNFAVSEVDMKGFTSLTGYRVYLEQYFKYYYARLSTPEHAVVIGKISEAGIEGKDTMIGTNFIIPFSEFHPKGKIILPGETLVGLSSISFLYDKSKLPEFHPVFSRLLKLTEVK